MSTFTSEYKLSVKMLDNLTISGLQVSVVGLERALHHYTLEPSEKPFDMKTVPLATQPITEQRTVAGL